MSIRIFVVLAALVLAWPAAARAQALPPTAITIPRVDAAPRLEDFLPGGTPPGLKVSDFRQRQPRDLEPASQPTAAYLSYDAEHLYVGFVCAQPRATSGRGLQKREDVEADDRVGIYLDTFRDRQRAYFPVVTARHPADGIINDRAAKRTSASTRSDRAGPRHRRGYVVLMRCPSRCCAFRPAMAAVGRVLVRHIRSNGETAFWPGKHRTGQRVSSSQFATAGGIAGVSPAARNITHSLRHFTGARLVDDATAALCAARRPAGLDVKLVPRDAVTLDFTINPDFSQVESDEPQVTVQPALRGVSFPRSGRLLENADFLPRDHAVLLAAL